MKVSPGRKLKGLWNAPAGSWDALNTARKSKDVYLTTEENIKRETAIIDRMKEGKEQVNSLSQEQSEAAFDKLKNRKEARGQILYAEPRTEERYSLRINKPRQASLYTRACRNR